MSIAVLRLPMTNDRIEKLAKESESALETALSDRVPASDASAALTHLLYAFDARRRSREAIAIAETARAASSLSR